MVGVDGNGAVDAAGAGGGRLTMGLSDLYNNH